MIDLLDTEGDDLYFVDPLPLEIDALMKQASENYGSGEAELPLLRAYAFSNRHLITLVGLYRFYYYQHRLEDTLKIAEQAIEIAGKKLDLEQDWTDLKADVFSQKAQEKNLISMARFYLLALKGWAFIHLRLHHFDEGISALKKILELDPEDQLGAKVILETVEETRASEEPDNEIISTQATQTTGQ